MSTIQRLICVGLLSFAAQACTTPADLAEVQQQLTGRFDWVASSGGIAGFHYTPATVGYDVRLEFSGARVRAYRDGEFIGGASVSVREDSMRAGPAPVYIVQYHPAVQVFPFAAFEQHTMHLSGKLTVELVDPCCDRFSHTFNKHGVR